MTALPLRARRRRRQRSPLAVSLMTNAILLTLLLLAVFWDDLLWATVPMAR